MALTPSAFTAAERELIRSEFIIRFGQAPRIANGIALRIWRAGAQAGQPKVPKTVAGLLERGLVEIGPGTYGPCARFTPVGLGALRTMARDRRALDAKRYAHILEELGLEVADLAQSEAGA